MIQRQLPPRYAVHYEEVLPSEPAPSRTGGKSDTVQAHSLLTNGLMQEREAITLAGARSIQRALQRRGYHVHGVYERINIRPRESLEVLHCGNLEWEWDGERPVEEHC